MRGGIWTDGRKIIHRRGDSGVLALISWWYPNQTSAILYQRGLTGKLTVKKRWHDDENVFQLELTDDGAFYFPAELTKELKPGLYDYDVEITLGDTVRTIATGKYKLLPDVTR